LRFMGVSVVGLYGTKLRLKQASRRFGDNGREL